MPKPEPGSIAFAPRGIDSRAAGAHHRPMVTPSDLEPAGRASWRDWFRASRPEVSAWWAWLSGRLPELSLLLSVLVVIGGIWLFLGIAEEMQEGELEQIDRNLLLLFRNPADLSDPRGPPRLEEAMRDLTALGSIVVLTLITLAVAGYLELARKRRAALFLLAAIGGGVAISLALAPASSARGRRS